MGSASKKKRGTLGVGDFSWLLLRTEEFFHDDGIRSRGVADEVMMGLNSDGNNASSELSVRGMEGPPILIPMPNIHYISEGSRGQLGR